MNEGGHNTARSPAWTWRVTNYATQVETDKRLSWVRCSVEGQPGATVRLAARDGGLDLAAEAGCRPEYGPCACELGPVGAGWYRLAVEGQAAAVDLWLDGAGSASVHFSPADKAPHALLLGRMMAHQGNFLALTRYVARFGAVVTFDPEEAARARHVILVGAPHLVSHEVEQDLRQAGARVERVQGDIAAQLDRAVEAGTPYLAA